MSKNATGRYSVGQEIYGICFKYIDKDTNVKIVSSSVSSVTMNDVPEDIEFKKFIVTEHHKVGKEYDPTDMTADGYILKDENGLIYHNQYPIATYEQVSDSNDRIFTRSSDGMTQEEIQSLVDNEYENPYEYISISVITVIEKVKNVNKYPTLREKYKKLYEMIITKFTEKYPGKKIEIVPYKFTSENGKFDWYPEIMRACVVDI